MASKLFSAIVGIIGLIILALSIIVWFVLPGIVDGEINKQVAFKNGTEIFDNWVDIPLPVYLDVYMFNVTNPDDISKDNTIKPTLEEFGPYVFKVIRDREILETTKEGTVIYNEKRSYQFQKEKSGNFSLDDKYMMINMLLVAVASQTDLLPTVESMLEKFKLDKEPMINGDRFIECSVGQFLFDGCVDPKLDNLYQLINGMMEGVQLNPLANNLIDKYEMDTGENDINNLGHIVRWRKAKLPNDSGNGKFVDTTKAIWSGDASCGMLNGSDGTIFPPHLKKDEDRYVFVQDVCRSFRLEYTKEVTLKGFSVYHYVMPKETFESARENTDNKCFCNKYPKVCFKENGLFDVGRCKGDAPIAASNPHFAGDYPNLQNSFNGLHPDLEKHQLYLEIEPRLGIPMRAEKKMQLNLVIPTGELGIFKTVGNLPATAFPIFWINERVEITDELAKKIDGLLDFYLRIAKGVLITGFVVGSLLILAGFGFFGWIFTKKESDKDVPLQMKGNFRRK